MISLLLYLWQTAYPDSQTSDLRVARERPECVVASELDSLRIRIQTTKTSWETKKTLCRFPFRRENTTRSAIK